MLYEVITLLGELRVLPRAPGLRRKPDDLGRSVEPGRGFSVSQRAGGAWSEIACCDWLPPENEGAPSALDAPERLTAALGDAEPEVDVWVPNGLLLSRTVPDRKRAEDEPAERVAARAISGLTILRLV